MQTVEQCCQELIARYNLFKQEATRLSENIPALTPPEILHRCEQLAQMHSAMYQTRERFLQLLEFIGPSTLDAAYLGEFQRTLDKSILACDGLFQEILDYRQRLLPPDATACSAPLRPETLPF